MSFHLQGKISIMLRMGRYTGPKDRLSRREGKELFGRQREALQRRLKQPPGQHGERRASRMSTYGVQFREKQGVKRMYGLRERQFKRFLVLAYKNKDIPTGTALLQLLEQRLDNVVYRLGMAKTRPQARQFVSQGHILVNSAVLNVPSYIVKPGDVISMTQKMFANPFVLDILKQTQYIPAWMEVKEGAGHVLRVPERDEMDKDINEDLIIGFYSR